MPSLVKKFLIDFAAKSDIGLVRTENQDSFGKFPENNSDLDSPKGQLFIVADGMGGHKGGKEASSIAVKVVSNEFFNSTYDVSTAIKEAIEKANGAIYNQSGDKSEFGRMGTTCSTLVLHGDNGIIGHVGDSRIYRIENNTIEQLTNDHTKVQEMLREGILTPEEAVNYPSKSVLARALGVDENVRVDIIDNIPLKSGQSFILCSDGLAKVNKGEILSIVSKNNPSDACNVLVDLANERGGKDNVTVIVVKIDPVQTAPPHPVKPVKEKVNQVKVRNPKRKGGNGWLGVLIVFFIIIVLLIVEYRDYIFPGSPKRPLKQQPIGELPEIKPDKTRPDINLDESENKLLDQAGTYMKTRQYESAFRIYKSILDKEPMHQAALKGVNEIAAAYVSAGNDLMSSKNFEEALNYYKKAAEIQPSDDRIKNLIRLCESQLSFKEPGTDLSVSEEHPKTETGTGSDAIATNFDTPGWDYPGINKNEFSITRDEISFTNTLSEKFIIYNKDLFDVTISVNTEIDSRNSVLGIIIGYVSPLDYYIFNYRDGGNYTLQRIKGNDIEKLLVVRPKDGGQSSTRKMKIIYSDNLISLYDQNGLISSYKSVWGIFGKAGVYVDRNSSVKIRDILLRGKTTLN